MDGTDSHFWSLASLTADDTVGIVILLFLAAAVAFALGVRR